MRDAIAHVESLGATVVDVATVNGFVVQGSHVGVLAGPPVFAMFVASFGGWEQGWVLMAALGVAGLGVTAAIRAVERRRAHRRRSMMLPNRE